MTQPINLEKRPLPPETVEGLRPPRTGFPYFAHCNRFPFQPGAEPGSPSNAWWLADAAFLVYGDTNFIEAAFEKSPLPSQGFSLGWLGSPAYNRGLILRHEEAIVVVFRGTRLQAQTFFDVAELVLINQDDLWTDTQFFPASWKTGGKVHSGFLKAFSEIRSILDRVVERLDCGQKLWLTGHSLGGALATLAAAHLNCDQIQGVHTYGAPRVGDAAFMATIPHAKLARYVHRDDWVPTVPPALLGYAHPGVLHTLNSRQTRNLWDDFRTGTSELAASILAQSREGRYSVDSLPFKISGIADHAAIYYATLLWNTLVEA